MSHPHPPLGRVAHGLAEKRVAAFQADMDAWREIAIATDFA